MKKLLIVTLALMSLVANAGVKVNSLELKSAGANGSVVIGLAGHYSKQPDLKINGDTIELSIPDADQFTAHNKKRTLNTKLDTSLTAENKNGTAVIKVQLPFSLAGKNDSVALTWKNNNIEVVFPVQKTAAKPATTAPAAPATTTAAKGNKADAVAVSTKITKEVLDEEYLNNLVKEQNGIKAQAEKAEAKNPQAAPAPVTQDKVEAKQAAVYRETHIRQPNAAMGNGNEYSFVGYAVKFTVFLALVLGLFYGVVQLMKRGVFKRGKLGFLNNSQMIEVLSTTYIAPKRSLMVVKAHKQVFLVSSSESGLQFLSEITDTSGIIKETEKFITGNNFDTKFDESDADDYIDAKIKLKENIMESTPIKENTNALAKVSEATKDIVKFSDELKKKARKLKPLEFN
ncbi:MAG: FliO/MopB family protein [Bacteriovoracaceae bacterium]